MRTTYQVSPFADQGTDGTGHLSDFVKLFEIPRRTMFMQNVLACAGLPARPAESRYVDTYIVEFVVDVAEQTMHVDRVRRA